MPPKTNPKVSEAVRLVLDGHDTRTALKKVGLYFCKSMVRNVNKQVAARKQSEAVAAREAPPEVLTAAQRTASEAVAAASAALAVVERVLKDGVEVAAAAPDLADVVGGRRNRKQAQAVRAQKDAAKAQRKTRKSDAHKGATLAFEAEVKKHRSKRRTALDLCAGLHL